MKKWIIFFSVAFIFAGCEKTGLEIENLPDAELMLKKASKNEGCVTIQSGEIYSSAGFVIEPGFDEWGYNYQAHMFNGTYCDAYYDDVWCQEYKDDYLIMKWNDAWLSNMDCNEDGLLDRHSGFDSYIGSGAWLTNHQKGIFEDEEGNICEWDYFIKIIAVPEDAVLIDGIWYQTDGTEIGPMIWSQFAVIQEVINDPCNGLEGLQYLSPDHAGLGNW